MVKNNGHSVVLTLAEAKELATELRKKNKKVILTQGSWDMIHVGHARYLAQAKKHGDVLIVGADSDEKIRHRKGKARPVVPEDERLEMLTYLGSVDYVVLKQLEAPKYSLIKAVKPDVLVVIKQNYSDKQIKEIQKFCKKKHVC